MIRGTRIIGCVTSHRNGRVQAVLRGVGNFGEVRGACAYPALHCPITSGSLKPQQPGRSAHREPRRDCGARSGPLPSAKQRLPGSIAPVEVPHSSEGSSATE
jgi:hypothetical protein